MAGYERNPKLQRRLAVLLVVVETLALTGNFGMIFLAYANYLNVLVNHLLGPFGLLVAMGAVTAVWLVIVALECRQYLKGQPRVRRILIIQNAVLIVLGLGWYLHSLVSNWPARPERTIGIGGLMLPLATLFPLLWPLLVFKPTSEPPAAPAASAPRPPARPSAAPPQAPGRPGL